MEMGYDPGCGEGESPWQQMGQKGDNVVPIRSFVSGWALDLSYDELQDEAKA